MVGGVERGTTPTTVNLKKPGISEQRITIVKEGYEDKTITLQKEFATASIFNLFGPTIVGFGIDAASGALFNYSPTQYTVDLDEAGSNEDSDSMKDNVDDRNVYQLRSLRQNAHGQYIIPGQLQDVSIINTSTGAVYTTK